MLRADLIPQQFRNSTPNTVMGWSISGVPTNIGIFTPATALLDGSIGLIPKPLAGQQDYILSNNGWIVAPTGGGGGGNPPGGALTEMQVNAGATTFGGSKVFVPSNGNIVLGDNALVGDRTISINSSSSSSAMILKYKGPSGSFRIQQDSSDRAVFSSTGISLKTIGDFSVTDTTDGDGLYYSTTTNILGYRASVSAGPTPFVIESGAGTSANNNAGTLTVKGADAFAGGGNGNGGSVTIQSGQRRVAGSGVDGNITVDAQGGYLNLSATAFKLNGVIAGDPSTMFFGADGSWKVPAGTGLTPAGADTEIQVKNASALGAGKVFIPSDGNLNFGDSGLAGALRSFTIAGSDTYVGFKFLSKAAANQRAVHIGVQSSIIPGSTDIGDIVIGADIASGSERVIAAGTQIGGNADLGLRSSGTIGMINLRANAVGIFSRAGTTFGGIYITIPGGSGEDTYQQQTTISANRPLSFRSCNGDAAINSGRAIIIAAGSALTTSGNGNGGGVMIQSGQRRVAGTGQDGAISIDARSGSMLLSAFGSISLNAGPSGAAITASSVDFVTNAVKVRGTSTPIVTIGDPTNLNSKLKSNDGTLGSESGAVLNINGGDAYLASGNGNGGNIVIRSGQRRTSGSGVDGNIYIDTLTGYLIISVIPTSSVGLPSGTVWSNSNALMRVP